MYAAIHIPDFHLQAVLRKECGNSAAAPVALLDESAAGSASKDRGKARILQLTLAARREGVEPGMTATQGLARCPALRLLNRSEADERTAQRLLLACGAAFSPDIENTRPGVCTIDLLGSPCLPDRLEELGEKIRASLAASFGHSGCSVLDAGCSLRGTSIQHPVVGIAENPDLALLAARLTRTTKIIRAERAEIGRFLAPLPVEAIGPSAELLSVLDLWGIDTLGDLTALPGQEVVERLGPEAARLWEQATGGRRRLLKLVRPPADYSQEMEFEHAIEQLDPLLFLIRRMLETIAARLGAAYRVAEEIILRLTLDDATTHERRFRVPDPSRDVDLLFRMLHTWLEGVTTESPVVGLRLEAVPVRPGARQFHLFESSLRDPNRFSETMARLEALLGSDRIGTPALLPSHRPDAFAMKPFKESNENRETTRASHSGRKPKIVSTLPAAGVNGCNVTLPLGLPLRRFRPALRVEVDTRYDPAHAVEYPRRIYSSTVNGRLLRRRGPWLGSGDWWEDRHSWSRQEWDVQLENGSIYRLVREEYQWLLEGIYG